MYDVVIVGAGPVGLWSACQAKIRNPSLRIKMVERYVEYQRNNTLILNPKSFYEIPDHQGLEEIVKEFTEHRTIKTNVIEDRLKNLAQKLGIEIQAPYVFENYKQLERDFPEAKVIVGADGSKSKVREFVCGDDETLKKKKVLQRIIDVRYLINGDSAPFTSVRKVAMTSKADFAAPHAGPKENGVTPASIRFFINKEEFDSIGEASFKNPCQVKDLPEKLRKRVQTWLDAKREAKEDIDSESIKVTKVELLEYTSSHFVKKIANRIVLLVGDAAFGVPYFRSLNNGFLSGTQLAKEISELDPQSNSIPTFTDYVDYMKKHSNKEVWWAEMKSRMYRKGLKVAHSSHTSCLKVEQTSSPVMNFLSSLIAKLFGRS